MKRTHREWIADVIRTPGQEAHAMSAEFMSRVGFLTRSLGRDPEDPDVHPAASHAVAELLREWRAAERTLAGLDPGSDAWARLQDEIDSLRQRYQDAFNALSNSDPPGSSA